MPWPLSFAVFLPAANAGSATRHRRGRHTQRRSSLLREIQQRIRSYELMAVFSPDVNEDELPGAIERVGSYIEQAGGTIISTNHESPWGRRRLAYPIRYQGRDVRDGYY